MQQHHRLDSDAFGDAATLCGMPVTFFDSQPRTWTMGALVTDSQRVLFISGQIPATPEGEIPEGFDAQCRLAWRNVFKVLHDAGMTVENLVKVTVFLSDRCFCDANARIWREMLGRQRPALTIIIAGIYDEAWLLEIEAIASA